MSNGQRFLVVVNKSFDLVHEGRRLDGLRISENGRGYRKSIFLDKVEFDWLLDALKDFYWRRNGGNWAKASGAKKL